MGDPRAGKEQHHPRERQEQRQQGTAAEQGGGGDRTGYLLFRKCVPSSLGWESSSGAVGVVISGSRGCNQQETSAYLLSQATAG